MKINKRFLLAAIFGLALAFTFSCSSGGDNDSGSSGNSVLFSVNPQIYYYDSGEAYKGSGLIDVTSHVAGGSDMDTEWDHIKAGSATNGVVNLNLPTGSPDEYLRNFLDDFGGQEGCSGSYQDIKIGGGFFVLTDNKGEYIGTMKIRYRDEQIQEEIMYMYFSKTGKITCNREKAIIDIDAKKGWNDIYMVSNRKDNMRTLSTKNILTKEKQMKWLF